MVMMTGYLPSLSGLYTLARHMPPSLSGMSTFLSKIRLDRVVVVRIALAPVTASLIGMIVLVMV